MSPAKRNVIYFVSGLVVLAATIGYLCPAYTLQYLAHKLGVTRAVVANTEIVLGDEWVPPLFDLPPSHNPSTGRVRPYLVLSKLEPQKNKVIDRMGIYKDQWTGAEQRPDVSATNVRDFPWGQAEIIHLPGTSESVRPDDWIIVAVPKHGLILMVKSMEVLSEIKSIRSTESAVATKP